MRSRIGVCYLLIKLRFNKLCLLSINQFRVLFHLGYYRNNKIGNTIIYTIFKMVIGHCIVQRVFWIIWRA